MDYDLKVVIDRHKVTYITYSICICTLQEYFVVIIGNGQPSMDPSGGPNSQYGRPNMSNSSQQSVQYIPLDAGSVPGSQGPGASQQTTYYMQQPMYLDQNGQPMYYRVG